MPKQLVVPGHGLRWEGRVHTYFGWGSGEGSAECSCGQRSERLPTTAARQRWHRAHKEEVLAAKEANHA